MLDLVISQRSHGDAAIATRTRVKLIIKGIDPERFDADSPDDPEILARVRAVAAELGVELPQ
jgi:hypothetical protein